MASGASVIDGGLCAPVVHEPDLAAVAPVFDVTVGQDDLALDEDDAVYEVGVGDTGGGSGAKMPCTWCGACRGGCASGRYRPGTSTCCDGALCTRTRPIPCQPRAMGRRVARGAVVCVCVWLGASGRWWTCETWTRTRLGARWDWRGLSLGTAGDGCGCAGLTWRAWLGCVRCAGCGCMAGCRGRA